MKMLNQLRTPRTESREIPPLNQHGRAATFPCAPHLTFRIDDPSETDRLITRRRKPSSDYTMMCVTAVMCSILVSLGLVMTMLYFQINDVVHNVSVSVTPLISPGVQNIATVLNNSAVLSARVTSTAIQLDELTTTSVPVLRTMMNETLRLMERLQAFSSHPNINIGMG